ncbi:MULTISPECIES: cytochrome c oxidase subunit 4 [Streptomycetaceae]|uniref:cytochrome c oxidase subunit 4 n=1 Tax=Streptomycetaceae TaxID=2062 RepID=UPI0005F9586D|nr:MULTISPECIES: cytochrome c oxidase subunit 4 [Streptomycetaceae]KJY39094.1 cytochrome C oxidase subunit IV [Streptomyces sp. NRRL S-495]MCX4685155.1 cytochrome c oxidase subunit 4 [Kitasatospora purpeofusca]MCX4752330.1 cytochrome c oxidase subunit 4 [Kitasatospora purpeofusca]MDY0816691.1 cytochrome c oxidase subunit 4 [Kitasatospora purpeofusca]WSR31909.1 cytochrome c oxidase subunit 4 [Kitasatospora purpeofusca]
MREQGKIFLGLAVFVLAMAITYGLWTNSSDHGIEAAGTTALFLAFALCAFIGYYLAFTARRVDSGAGDNPEAEVADDSGELGFFAPHSWQPLSLAVGGALAFLGVIFGWWLLYWSIPVILIGLFGWVFEFYRGENQNQ